ncbi:MAG: hypothetical protein FWG06_02355, partial [Clostridiales bacterium]|nr:hypothetical protein [Clostridiales bacterium]
VNNSNFVSNVQSLRLGAAITQTALTVMGTEYTRAQLLMMPRAERTYSGTTVRGVPLAALLEDVGGSALIEFQTYDAWAGISAYNLTKEELVEKNAILAYETKSGDTWTGYVRPASGEAAAYIRLWADDLGGAHGVTTVSEKAVVASPYKHITYAGAPYNIDAITGATLTVEGPGVSSSVPVSVRELEEAASANIHRDVYSDSRGSGSVSFSYEGVKLLSILDGLINAQVERLDDDVVVVFKNRWRQEVGRAAYADIKNAEKPVIMAYGTASTDETAIPPAPFVFNLAAGIVSGLGNDDGPLKLVYDQSEFLSLAAANPKFASVAYLYIEEGTPPPGFKHTTATDPAYSNKVNTEYIVTFTGAALGREINFTVEELEKMVEYEDGRPKAEGLGHRGEYSLSNTTYWYVNEYEGIKVWDLLTGIGVDKARYQNDDSTLVSFSAWDNYQITAQFSMKQLADPNLFYFYEKSPLDIGTDRPTKAQLATKEYQPDNQGPAEGWTTDSNGYPIKKGYPVLLAYGLNGYPYVRDSNLPGYKSGLGNHGGPMRVIYGKTDGLNRSDPDAVENYAYFFNNGSQQLQRVQEVYVGEPIRYSTHLENPAPAYQDMKNRQALRVEIVSGGSTQVHDFTLAELESILYGPGISKRDRDTEGRQEKGYYITRIAGTNPIHELYEGVNLEYLLKEQIGLQGSLGTVEMYSGSGTAPEGIYDLADISEKGFNSGKGTEGLGMMVAFAKNGFPLVDGANNATENTNPGYVHNDPLDAGKGIRNGLGPLHFVRAQTAAENATGTVNSTVGDAKTLVENLSKIVVRLDPDVFAHVGPEYEVYANQSVLFSGAVAQLGGKSITVGSLETRQRYMVTGSYTIGGVANVYRGLDLAGLLNDKDIGASALMDGITAKNSSGGSTTLTLAELTGKKAILAYGIAKTGDAQDGKPLVPTAASPGYDAAYFNSGGPLRLIFTDGTAAECITDVREIEVAAAALEGWKHTGGNFAQYASFELAVSGQNLAHNKTYTVAELEAMDNIIVSDSYQMGGPTWIQGVDLYKLLQSIGFAAELDSSAFTANSVDNYPISFNASDLKNGVNGKPILIAFGQGVNSANGLPLVPEITSPGFDPNIGNSYGPLRLVVHDNTGWCVKYLNSIVVGAAGGTVEPVDELDFNIYGLRGGTVSYDIRAIKNLPQGMGTKLAEYKYTSGGLITEAVKGAYLYDILAANGVSDSATVTVNTTDGYEASQADYRDIPMSDIKSLGYFVAYDAGPNVDDLSAVKDADKQTPPVTATVRIYRNFNDGSNWRNRLTNIKGVTVADYGFTLYPGGANGMPQASIRAVAIDSAGGIWAGSNGAGAAYISGSGEITRYSAPALKTDFVTGIAIAPDGGVWLAQGGSVGSQTAPPTAHFGFARYQNGQFTFYDKTSTNSTLPSDCVYGIDVDKNGNVWLATQHTLLNGGMEGGLTKFVPSANTWQTWKMGDGLPTVSAWAVKGDGKGGAWVTTYRTSNITLPWPDESYAHVSADGVVNSYPITSGNAFNWSRSVAIAPDGGVYITRMSGAHDPANDGGWLDHIAPNGTVTAYKGNDIIPDIKNAKEPGFSPEIRTVFVDAGGDIWLGTNGLGVYSCGLSGGNITVKEHYCSENGSWPPGAFDDVWSVYVSPEGIVCFGSNGGVARTKVTLTPLPPVIDPPNPGAGYVGDATAATAELTITGAVEKPGYFTVNGLKTYPGVTARTKVYNWQNSFGTAG